jgi:hypothetical protein
MNDAKYNGLDSAVQVRPSAPAILQLAMLNAGHTAILEASSDSPEM